MSKLWLLLTVQFRSIWNSLRKSERKVLRLIGAVVLGIMVSGFFTTTSFSIFSFLARRQSFQEIQILLTGGFTASFVLLLFSSFSFAISSLYEAKDLHLLLSSPLKPRIVFLNKFITSFLGILGLNIFFIPILISLGLALKAQPVFYPLALIGLLIFALVPSALGQLIMMLSMKILPAKKGKEILGVVSTLFGLGIWLGVQFLQNVIIRPQLQQFGTVLVHQKSVTFLDYLPSGWAAHFTLSWSRGFFAESWPAFLLLTVFSLIVSALCLFMAETLYLSGWSGSQESHRQAKVTPSKKRSEGLLALFPPQQQAIMEKDFKMIVRNPQELIQLIIPAFFICFYVWQMSRSSTQAGYPGSTVSFGFLAFLLSMMFGGTAMRAVPREGKAIQLLTTSPASVTQLLLGKFWVAYLPILFLAEAILALTILINGNDLSWVSFPATALMCLSFTSLGVAMGVHHGRFDTVNPKKMVSGSGALLWMLLNLILLGVFQLVLFLTSLGANLWNPAAAYTIGGGAFLAITVLSTWLPFRSASHCLVKMEWAFELSNND